MEMSVHNGGIGGWLRLNNAHRHGHGLAPRKSFAKPLIDLPIIQQYLHDEQNQLVGNSDFSLIQPTVRPRMINICVSSRIPFDPYQSVCPFLRLSMENHHVQRTFPAGWDQNHGDLPHRGFGC
jgi:hypothetical protein